MNDAEPYYDDKQLRADEVIAVTVADFLALLRAMRRFILPARS